MNKSVFITALTWCIVTAVFSNYANTMFLQHFGDILAHNVSRFSVSVLACLTLGSLMGYKNFVIPFDQIPEKMGILLLPMASMVVMNTSTSVALTHSGVTLTYVVKSSIPLWTVLWSYTQGERYPLLVWPALLMCCAGVAVASFTDFEFTTLGFTAALISTWSQTCFNISSKKCIQKANISATQSFFVSMIFCFLAVQVLYRLQFYIFDDMQPVFRAAAWDSIVLGQYMSMALIVGAGLTYFHEYQLNFVYVTQVTPLTFAITDIVRRLGTIACNSFMFDKILSPLNQFGIALALGGAVWYSVIVTSGAGPSHAQAQASPRKIEHPHASQAAKTLPKPKRLSHVDPTPKRLMPKRIPSADWTEPTKPAEDLTPIAPRKSVPRVLEEQLECDTLMTYNEDLLPMSPSRVSRYSVASASSSSTASPTSPDKMSSGGGPKFDSYSGKARGNNQNRKKSNGVRQRWQPRVS